MPQNLKLASKPKDTVISQMYLLTSCICMHVNLIMTLYGLLHTHVKMAMPSVAV